MHYYQIHAVPGLIVVMMSSLLVKQVLEIGISNIIVYCSPVVLSLVVVLHTVLNSHKVMVKSLG